MYRKARYALWNMESEGLFIRMYDTCHFDKYMGTGVQLHISIATKNYLVIRFVGIPHSTR